MIGIQLAERKLLPDWVVRFGIRRLLRARLVQESCSQDAKQNPRFQELVASLRRGPIAVATEKANEQHYEVPAKFFESVLGKTMKYSCCYYPTGQENLDDAEEAMLNLCCERARLEDGMRVLDLGCGWGSLACWIAERYPRCEVVGLSNSHSQREKILERATREGLNNLRIITRNINDFKTDLKFDRVLSVEMFEHMRNYQNLLKKISMLMQEDARLFVHIFTHHRLAYFFETKGQKNWMGRHFFTGGIMPSDDLLLNFQENVELEERWGVNGQNYAKTANHWLANMDSIHDELLSVLAAAYGNDHAKLCYQRWRMFFMACSELFGFNNGEEWHVCHYRFRKKCKVS